MATVINIFTRESFVIPESKFIPIENELLNSTSPLTKDQLKRIKSSIKESERIANQCEDKDHDVMDYHDNYINRCMDRIEFSAQLKTKKRSKSKLKMIQS
jgi:hypothetical protein